MSTGNVVWEDEIAEMCSLRREGLSVSEIAEKVSRSEATVKRYLVANGLPHREVKSRYKPLTLKQYNTIAISKAHGMMSPEVAALIRQPLAEVNAAYSSANYQHYIDHR